MAESLLAMWATGGERAEDLAQFRQDKALAVLLGHDLPAAQTARDFLVQFHAEDLPLLQDGKAPVAAETVPLLGLTKANAAYGVALHDHLIIGRNGHISRRELGEI
jgi:hypothetical protein